MAAAPEPLEERIRVLVADDERLFVEMVEALLAADPRIDVVARAYNGREAVDQALALDPHACILVLTGGNNPADIAEARKVGAAAYLTKDRIANELIPAIHDLGSH